MAEETDGVLDATDEQLRIALTVASQFGERLARLREEFARSRQSRAEQEHRELQNRFDAERGAARASLAVVDRPEWWNNASVRDIADVRETATTWRDHDDVAKTASEKIREEVKSRYGVDVDRPGADPREVADALRQAEQDRAAEREERRRSDEDLTASQTLLEQAERRDRDATNARQEPGTDPAVADQAQRDADSARESSSLAYDSAERRQEFANSLQGKASESEIRARLIADTANAEPARNAVKSRSRQAPRAPQRQPGAQRDRGGLSR